MIKDRKLTYYGIGLAAVLVISFIGLQPMQIWTQQDAPAKTPSDGGELTQLESDVMAAPAVDFCIISTTLKPQDATDMNTALIGTTVKTIHVEKEVFNCRLASNQPVIVDLSIYTEIIEDIVTKVTQKRTYVVQKCVKATNGGVLGCSMFLAPVQIITVANCQPATPAPFPIEMNTVSGIFNIGGVNTKLIKTIEAQKEVFLCDPVNAIPTKVRDVLLFVEMFENLNSLGNPIIVKSEVTTCVKEIKRALVLQCYAGVVPVP